ncbi:MAG: NlpC/P60 family protein [Gammaproteobacteria bacterium]|nr:NlpC/P60 family protein [Gammaproteobacteria bacterium]
MKIISTLPHLIQKSFALGFISIVIVFAGCSSAPQKPVETSNANNETKTPAKIYKRSTPVKYSTGHQIVSIAESLIGSPYKYGGASPNGFDCSGLVYYTHRQLNITVPRTTKQQAQHSANKNLASAKPGDILFFRIYGNNVSHVGIYAGNDQFIHAPKSGKYVSYANINEPYWRQRLIKVASLH